MVTALAETTMSLFLPPEILDLIVDHLHDKPTTLRASCLVSKSWVPRTRKHLFDQVNFSPRGSTPESWMQTFPDPSNSPARYTRTLYLSDIKVVATAISDALPWIRAFNNIVNLRVNPVERRYGHQISFTQFHGISPTLKSINLSYNLVQPSEVLDLVCSFPLLEDLTLFSVTPRPKGNTNTNKWNVLHC